MPGLYRCSFRDARRVTLEAALFRENMGASGAPSGAARVLARHARRRRSLLLNHEDIPLDNARDEQDGWDLYQQAILALFGMRG